MARPQRKNKQTAKAKALTEDRDDFAVHNNPGRIRGKGTSKRRKLTPKAKAHKGSGSQDELAALSDGTDGEDEVEFLTTDPKSPFADTDLMVRLPLQLRDSWPDLKYYADHS